jgi:radical SAM protein with 4Fe4S-binding SPASM domain
MSLTREFAVKLKNAGCKGVAISLDGANAETHDQWRGVGGAWARTIQGAKNCAEAGLAFQIAPLLHAGNWTQLRGIAEIAGNLGSEAVELFDFVPAGRAKMHPDYELGTEERKKIIEETISLQRKSDLTFRVIGLPQYWPMVERTVPEDEIFSSFVRSCCAAGTRYITILSSGDVIPCMVLQVKVGNVRERGLVEIWRNSQVLQDLRNRDNLKGKCGICRYRKTCAGARCKAYEKSGDILAEDPACWFTEDEIREERIY